MRAVVIRSLLVIAAGGIVLAGVLYVASTVDARPPEVLEVALTQPVADEADRALITTSIEITFSEPIDPETATDVVELEPPVDGTASWSGSTLIFTPSEPLDLETEYTVRVSPGLRDMAGNEMEDAPPPFVFATTGRPSLAATEPADGAADVPVDAAIEVVFSGLMDTASVESALEVEPTFGYELRWSGQRLEIVPDEPLDPATEYVVRVGEGATDVAGVAMADAVAFGFRTVAPGLAVRGVVPVDAADGISPRTPIAVVLDRAVDPASVGDDVLQFTPDLAGTLELVEPADEPGTSRILRFTPSAPLPPNTTVEVELAPGLRAADGGTLAEPLTWSFTTGAPQATLSNQVLFLSDRGGVRNVWAMNADGTGQHQVSAELEPILDYAAAPTGGSLIVADGRRLIFLRADGSERQVLTEPAHLEFDPAYAPDGSRVVFGRVDAETGAGLGLWAWEVGAGAAERVRLPGFDDDGSSPSPAPGDEGDAALRAPRYSPDGNALAFVDTAGSLGILELPAQRLTLVDADAAGTPAWDARSSAILVRLRADDAPDPARLAAPVGPPDSVDGGRAGMVRRSGTTLRVLDLDGAAQRIVTAPDGRVAWIDLDGTVRVADGLDQPFSVPDGLAGVNASEIVFGPAEDVVLVVVNATTRGGAVERVDLSSGERIRLIPDGARVRWLP